MKQKVDAFLDDPKLTINGKETPKVWWRRIPCDRPDIVGDLKIPWELNRHQYFLTLAKAYLLTHDERYLETFCNLVESWCKANPPKRGINWASSLELAYRSIAWIWAINLFELSKPLPVSTLERLHRFLALQAEYIEHNLSVYFSPNTHLTGEALALLYVGTFFGDNASAKRWTARGQEILLSALSKHVLPDGGYMERSLWYHRYTLDIYLHFLLLARKYAMEIPGEVEGKVEQLGEFLMFASTPDRHFPLIGDDDGGRLLPLDDLDGNDLRGLFSTLAVLFKRSDFKYLSEGFQEETFWLLAPESQKAYERLPKEEPSSISQGFEPTGFFFMRSGWSEEASYAAFDCGPHGWLNGGHAHADLLSFQLQKGARSFVVDPGTYTYAGPERNWFRGPHAHASVCVDDQHPAAPESSFQWASVPKHELLSCQAEEAFSHAAGRMETAFGWSQLREILFVRPNLLCVVDLIQGIGLGRIEWRFPLSGTNWTVQNNTCISTDSQTPWAVAFSMNDALVLELEDSWTSSCYGSKESGKILIVESETQLPCRLGALFNLSADGYRMALWTREGQDYLQVIALDSGRSLIEHPLST